MAIIKNQNPASVDEDGDKLEPLCTVKITHHMVIRSSNSTSGYIPKRIESRDSKRYLDTHVRSSIIHKSKRWKQPKCPSTDEWRNKLWFIHTMEYYSALKMNEILIHATTWMNLEDIILSEISQMRKDKYCKIPPR